VGYKFSGICVRLFCVTDHMDNALLGWYVNERLMIGK